MKSLFYLLLFLPLVSPAQSFTINGHVREFKDGDKLYLAYHVNGVLYKDSATAKDQSFVFSGNIHSPSFGFISARENPFSNIEVLHNSLNFYIEPGNISITSTDSLKYAAITGTVNNHDYSELTSRLAPYRLKQRKLLDHFDALPPEQRKNKNSIAAMHKAYSMILNDMVPVQFAFIDEHKDSYISFATLRDMLNQADVNAVYNAYQHLSSRLQNSAEGIALGQRITSAKASGSGGIAADFTLPDVQDKPVTLSAYQGKYVLVDFWASWCLPCRQENPSLEKAFNRYKSKNFTILSVSIDNLNEKPAWLTAVKTDGLPWTQVLDSSKKVHDLYGVTYIPANFLLDPSGKIIAINLRDKVLIDKLSELFDVKK